MNLSNYIAICQTITSLMHPLVETVIHDLTSHTICYINGNLSKRKIGDPSLLETDITLKNYKLNEIAYPKINFDGRLIKSMSLLLEDKWLLCINVDISLFSKMKELSATFLGISLKNRPLHLFINDWQENLHIATHEYLQKHNLQLQELKPSHKKSLIGYLFELEAFNEKHAADYVAQLLQMGRATIFKHLKELRNKK